MLKNELVSIIVPVYNTEKYVNASVQSIINQTYPNIEIILVDDGAADNSGMMCDKFAKNNKNVRVIHKKNGGISDARNVGINSSKGEYLAFVDSDDIIKPDFIEKLYKALKKHHAQIAFCNMDLEEIDIKDERNSLIQYDDGLIDLKDYLKIKYTGSNKEQIITTVTCSKLYDRRLFDRFRFRVGKIYEDEFTTYKIISKAKRVAYVDDDLYRIIKNRTSVTRTKFTARNLDAIEAFEESIKYYDDIGLSDLSPLVADQILRFINRSYFLFSDDSLRKKLRKKYREYYGMVKKCSNISKREKAVRSIFYLSPRLFDWLSTVKK